MYITFEECTQFNLIFNPGAVLSPAAAGDAEQLLWDAAAADGAGARGKHACGGPDRRSAAPLELRRGVRTGPPSEAHPFPFHFICLLVYFLWKGYELCLW